MIRKLFIIQIILSLLEAKGERIQNAYVTRTELHRDILRNYNPKEVPGTKVSVIAESYVYHVSVNEKEQTMTVAMEMKLLWDDINLIWNPENYQNITQLHLYWHEVWSPWLVLVNGVEFRVPADTLCRININSPPTYSTVMYHLKFDAKVRCDFDFHEYPYDLQVCEVRFAMKDPEVEFYGYDVKYLNRLKTNIISNYEILHILSNLVDENFNDNIMPETHMVVKIVMKRRSPLFFATFTAPTIICSTLTVSSFFLHPTSSCFLLIPTMLIQFIFLHDMISKMPIPVTYPPKCIILYAIVMFITFSSFLGNLGFSQKPTSGKIQIITRIVLTAILSLVIIFFTI